MVALVTLLAVAVGLLGVLVAGLLRTHAEILRALHDLDVNLDPSRPGTTEGRAPRRRAQAGLAGPGHRVATGSDLAGTNPGGDAVSVAVLGPGRMTLLAFLTSSCLTCRGFWEAFDGDAIDVPGRSRLVVVTKGPEAESPAALRRLAPRSVPTVLSSEAWEAYGVPVAPYFVLVEGTTGQVVGEGAAATWDQVRNLMGQSLADAGLVDTDVAAEPGQGGADHRAASGGEARAGRVDAELRAAGIEPGHPTLHPLDQPGGPVPR